MSSNPQACAELIATIKLDLQGEEGRLYEDLGTYDLMKPVVEELLAEYNSKKKPMNLVFFDDAIEHLTRIHRILRLQQVLWCCNGTPPAFLPPQDGGASAAVMH